MNWNPYRIAAPTVEELRKAVPDVERMMVATLDAILDRFGRDEAYPFVDTKLSLMTGEDFPGGPDADPEHNFRGRHVLYLWIQGRALEALAGHAVWLPTCGVLSEPEQQARIGRIRVMLGHVMDALEQIRARNGGRLFAMMGLDGTPLTIDDDRRIVPHQGIPDESNYADLFYAKGLFAAATLLDRPEKMTEALASFDRIFANVEREHFVTTQQAFDPKNKVRPVPGRFTHGYRMISLGALALLHGATQDPLWLATAERFLRHLFTRHLNRGQFEAIEGLQPLDYVEFLDADGAPWREPDGEVLCDPGHALELVGFAAKLLPALGQGTPAQRELAAECLDLLPRVFAHIFELGWNARSHGICKAFGLIGRRPINDDMPWWNLPEVVRAGALLWAQVDDPAARADLLRGAAESLNALLQDYVNPRAHLMAYQTRNAQGEPVDVIPASPDADPAYHTGLSLIDALAALRRGDDGR